MDIFIDNKYTRWYHSIIGARLANPVAKGIYTESHHIIPESFYIERTREGPSGWLEGDSEAADNKVSLTGREHGLCHWLLTKMTEGTALIKCRQAFDMMGVGASHQERGMSRLTCRAFERNRINVAADRSDRMKMDNPMDDPEARTKVGNSKRGKKRGTFNKEWLDAMSDAKMGEKNNRYGVSVEESTKTLISAEISKYAWVNDGIVDHRVLKTEVDYHIKSGMTRGRVGGKKTGERPKIECPHCGTQSAANTYARFHGDKCKHKK